MEELALVGFEIVKSVFATIAAAESGKVTKEQALAALERMRAGLAANDAHADAALDSKFPR